MKLSQKLALPYLRARINILSLASPRKAAIKAFRLFCTPQQRSAKKGSAFFNNGEALSFHHASHTVRGHRWLPETSPAVKRVLIAHGFESASRNFETYIAAFVQKGYEVVAFDAPAHGASGGNRILLTDYISLLRNIEHNYGPFHSYMGHSLGGLALALFLENQPHHNVRLVLIAPAVETTLAVGNFARLLHLSPEVVREMDDYVQEISGHHFEWYSLRRALRYITAKTLYVQDEGDKITPVEDARRVQADGHPNVRFVFTTGLGHRRIYKDTTIMNRIIDFI